MHRVLIAEFLVPSCGDGSFGSIRFGCRSLLRLGAENVNVERRCDRMMMLGTISVG